MTETQSHFSVFTALVSLIAFDGYQPRRASRPRQRLFRKKARSKSTNSRLSLRAHPLRSEGLSVLIVNTTSVGGV